MLFPFLLNVMMQKKDQAKDAASVAREEMAKAQVILDESEAKVQGLDRRFDDILRAVKAAQAEEERVGQSS